MSAGMNGRSLPQRRALHHGGASSKARIPPNGPVCNGPDGGSGRELSNFFAAGESRVCSLPEAGDNSPQALRPTIVTGAVAVCLKLRKGETMPGPSSFTPRPVRPSLPAQRFTVAQATKSLPLVRRIVRDIVETHEHALDLQTRIESIPADDAAPTQKELDAAMDRLQTLVNELQEVGCELKDYRTGLIDYVGRH